MSKMHRKVKVVQLSAPTNFTTATDEQNSAVDTIGFTEALLVINIGVVSASVNLNVAIQHSDEAAANFAVVPVPVQTDINPRLLALSNANANTVQVAYLNLKALKRYIKPIDSLNANAALYSMSVILFGPDNSARTNDSAQPYKTDAT